MSEQAVGWKTPRNHTPTARSIHGDINLYALPVVFFFFFLFNMWKGMGRNMTTCASRIDSLCVRVCVCVRESPCMSFGAVNVCNKSAAVTLNLTINWHKNEMDIIFILLFIAHCTSHSVRCKHPSRHLNDVYGHDAWRQETASSIPLHITKEGLIWVVLHNCKRNVIKGSAERSKVNPPQVAEF